MVILLAILFAMTPCKGPDFHPTKEESKTEVLQSFTCGDQTDEFAIGLDSDQLEQEEELES